MDGASTDGTRDLILEIIEAERGRRDVKLIEQVPGFDYEAHGRDESGQPVGMLSLGKGDAVRKGFAAATGDILMILDADMTVAPEDLPKFYEEIRSGRGEYINGTRLVYSMEDKAMRFLNFYANQFFAKIFTFLLNQEFSDTLCGTKVIGKENYRRLSQNRGYFGDFDPFGDFDLIFGATKLNLKILEVPVRYKRRRYGTTQISRFKHGFLLIKMVLFAYRKLKLV